MDSNTGPWYYTKDGLTIKNGVKIKNKEIPNSVTTIHAVCDQVISMLDGG